MCSLNVQNKKRRQAYPVVEEVLKAHFQNRDIIGIEIGVLGGSWTAYMLDRLPNLVKLYCIDPWQHIDGGHLEQNLPQDKQDENFRDYCNKIKPHKDRVCTLRMTSDEAAEYFDPSINPNLGKVWGPVDFVYIDGNHHEDQVYRDIINYYKAIKPGGIIMGHDYGLAEGVTKWVKHFFTHNSTKNYFVGDDFVWWSYKTNHLPLPLEKQGVDYGRAEE